MEHPSGSVGLPGGISGGVGCLWRHRFRMTDESGAACESF